MCTQPPSCITDTRPVMRGLRPPVTREARAGTARNEAGRRGPDLRSNLAALGLASPLRGVVPLPS
eukprot:7123223-Alexandrium_andersonii.AAC.1